jgi:hypothetical protein
MFFRYLDDVMVGVLMVAISEEVIPFVADTWYLEKNEMVCRCVLSRVLVVKI